MAEIIGANKKKPKKTNANKNKEDYKNMLSALDEFVKAPPKKEYLNLKRAPSEGDKRLGNVIATIFSWKPEDGSVIDVSGGKMNEHRRITLPIAKIHFSTIDSYQPGDIVRLYDYKAGLVPNPRYEVWISHEANKSSGKKIGHEPPSRLDMSQQNYGIRMLRPNPLLPVVDQSSYWTFTLYDNDIVGEIDDIDMYLNQAKQILKKL